MCSRLLTSEKKTMFYTGIPNKEIYDTLFNYVKPRAQNLSYWQGEKKTKQSTVNPHSKRQGRNRKLPLEDEMLLTLMKLRLGLMNEDLCERFHVSHGVCSSIITTWIKFLAKELKGLVYYSSHEEIQHSLPSVWAKYPRITAILDCFETFTEKPRNLETASAMWSQYKHHYTLKVLVAITPRGSFSFVSHAWGGRTSDVKITRESGFLDLVDPGDQIMADNGFGAIREDLLMRKATLIKPPPAKGNHQQPQAEANETKRVANLRIHVERAIRRLRDFSILKHILPITLCPDIDDIVTICAALCNLQGPLVV